MTLLLALFRKMTSVVGGSFRISAVSLALPLSCRSSLSYFGILMGITWIIGILCRVKFWPVVTSWGIGGHREARVLGGHREEPAGREPVSDSSFCFTPTPTRSNKPTSSNSNSNSFQQFHSLVTKYSDIGAPGVIIQTTTVYWEPCEQNCHHLKPLKLRWSCSK